MKHGSLFSGIGGFDLAAEWMGWENVFHCEWNPFGQKVLKYYWPKAISYDDITKTDFTIHRGNIDILTGGFPCQPYSSAGKRKGKEDERHLWPQMLRAIREIAPSWVVGENVYGLVNWSGGLVFHEVQADLEAEGYEVFPFLLPAVSVNAPHRRDRIWFVAHNNSINGFGEKRQLVTQQEHRRFVSEIQGTLQEGNATDTNSRRLEGSITFGRNGINAERESESGIVADSDNNGLNECNGRDEFNASEGGEYALGDINESNGNGDATDTCNKGLEGQYREWNRCTEHRKDKGLFVGSENKFNATDPCCIRLEGSIQTRINDKQGWDIQQRRKIGKHIFENGAGIQFKNFPTVSPLCNGDDGLSNRLDSITFPKWRNESIKAGGNAIVPQVVYQIFKSIEQYERSNGRTDNKDCND